MLKKQIIYMLEIILKKKEKYTCKEEIVRAVLG